MPGAGCWVRDDGQEGGGLEDAGDEGIWRVISFLLIFLLPGRGSTNASRVSELRTRCRRCKPRHFLPTSNFQASKPSLRRGDLEV